MNIISEFDLSEMRKSVVFRNNELSTNLMDKEDIFVFFDYIENFCSENGISNKQVNDTLIVYPKDYDLINSSRKELSESYVAFYRSVESNSGYDGEFEIERILFDIDDNFDMKINSLTDIERVLLEIHNNVQKDTSVYTTEAEKQAVIDKRKKENDTIIAKQQAKLSKAEEKLNYELDVLGISMEHFKKLQKLNKKVKKALKETL